MTTAGTYCGPDRRARTRTVEADDRRGADAGGRRHGGRLLLLFAVVLVASAVPGFFIAPYAEPETLGLLRQGLAAVASSLFVAGGFAYLLRWKLTGEAPVALVGVALLVYGIGVGLFQPVGPALVGQQASPGLSSGLVRLMVSAVSIYLLVRSLSTPVVDSRLRPLRMFVVALVGVTAVFAAVGALMRASGAQAPTPGVDAALHAVICAGWAVAAYLLVRRGVDRLQGDVLWIGLALGSMAVSNALRVLAGGHSPGGLLSAVAVATVAAGVALYGTTFQLTQVLAGRGAAWMRLYVDLAARDAQERTQQASREERLHDVRSTLAAIRCAAGTLQRYEDKLELTQRTSLQTAVTQELVRLEKLIDPPPADQLQTFALEEVLAPLVATEQALGADIAVQLRGATAYARPHDVSRIVQNLLTNARRHAPGSRVRLSASTREGLVTVAVADEGPGVKVTLRDAIFERGRRGKSTGGSGLGLYVARQLALDLGGDLAVHDRIGGGAVFSLRLRSASPEQLADQVGDVGDAVQDEGRRAPVRRAKHGWLPGPVRQPQDVVAVGPVLPVQRDHRNHISGLTSR